MNDNFLGYSHFKEKISLDLRVKKILSDLFLKKIIFSS